MACTARSAGRAGRGVRACGGSSRAVHDAQASRTHPATRLTAGRPRAGLASLCSRSLPARPRLSCSGVDEAPSRSSSGPRAVRAWRWPWGLPWERRARHCLAESWLSPVPVGFKVQSLSVTDAHTFHLSSVS